MFNLVIHYLANRRYVPLQHYRKRTAQSWKKILKKILFFFFVLNSEEFSFPKIWKSSKSVSSKSMMSEEWLFFLNYIFVGLSGHSLAYLFPLSRACLLLSANDRSSPLLLMFLFSQCPTAHYVGNCCFREEEAGTQRRKVNHSRPHRVGW